MIRTDRLTACLPARLPARLPACLPTCLPACPSACLPARLPVIGGIEPSSRSLRNGESVPSLVARPHRNECAAAWRSNTRTRGS